MEKARLGKTNLMVTRLGFGGIPIQRDTEDESVAIVQRCLELGITFYDTANGYTTSEGRIGKAIKGQRENIVIATKSHSRTKEGIEKDLKLSLERLGVDYLDLYQFHGVSDMKSLDMVLDPAGPMTVVEKAKKEGIIRHIGITSHQIDVAKKAIQSDRFETIMFPFNFIAFEAEKELLPLARQHDVGFIAMKPFGGGLINNAAVALKFLFQFRDVVTIPGIEKIQEIEEIIKLLEGTKHLTDEDKHEMKRIQKELGSSFCHRCDYCQPCTVEIPISTVMSSKTFYKRMPPERVFTEMLEKAMVKAATCTECGECEERCPYHLKIREVLKEQVKYYNEEKKKYEKTHSR
jgi:uncharacterized protein